MSLICSVCFPVGVEVGKDFAWQTGVGRDGRCMALCPPNLAIWRQLGETDPFANSPRLSFPPSSSLPCYLQHKPSFHLDSSPLPSFLPGPNFPLFVWQTLPACFPERPS